MPASHTSHQWVAECAALRTRAPFVEGIRINLDRPAVCRVEDYLLGGAHNFAVDRALARKLLNAEPELARYTYASRAFVRRAVQVLAARGMRQFVQLGAGLPTSGSLHEVVPPARVAYVDADPVAVAITRLTLGADPRITAIRADLQRPAELLSALAATRAVDLDKPVAVLLIGALNFVAGQEHPARILAALRQALATDSAVVLSHASTEDAGRRPLGRLSALFRSAHIPMALRSRAHITSLLRGYRLLDPGLVAVDRWRPDDPPPDEAVPWLAAVAMTA